MAVKAKPSDEEQQTTTTGDVSTFFKNGDLLAPEEAATRATDAPESLAEWLAEVNPERHAKWVKACKANMFPDATDEELLNHSVQNELEEAEEEGRNLTVEVVEDAPSLTVTHEQDASNDRFMPDDTTDISWLPEFAQELMSESCPAMECDSKHITSKQMQMGGADEGMTGFHECEECGETWKTGYGA